MARQAQFIALRDAVEGIASDLFDKVPLIKGRTIRIFTKHIQKRLLAGRTDCDWLGAGYGQRRFAADHCRNEADEHGAITLRATIDSATTASASRSRRYPGVYNHSFRVQRNPPVRRAIFVPDSVDILALGTHAQKSELTCMARSSARLGPKFWQLLAGLLRRSVTLIFRRNWACRCDDPVNQPAKGCLRPQGLADRLFTFSSVADNLLRGCCVDAGHWIAHTTLMQDKGCCRPSFIRDETNLRVDNVTEKFRGALRMECDADLPVRRVSK